MTAETSILIVEDENIIANDIKATLESFDYRACGICSSGEEAITAVEKERPDLLIMDIKLKGDMDGITTAAQIQSRFSIPVIYLTAYADEDLLRRAKVTEVFGYLIKPFHSRELHTTIEIALYKHKTRLELEKRVREVTGLNNLLQKRLEEDLPKFDAARDIVMELQEISRDISRLSDRAASELLPDIQDATEPKGDSDSN